MGDVLALGQNKGLVLLGHARSEEAGMVYLAEWLRRKFPGLSIIHIPAGDPFRVI